MHHSFKLVLVTLVTFTAACTHSAEPEAAPGTPRSDAQALLAKGGEFRFVLGESPAVLAKVTKGCASDARPDACVQRIAEAGAQEGWRFVPVDANHVQMQSFGSENGQEEVYLEGQALIVPEEGASLTLRPVTTLVGTRLPAPDQRQRAVHVTVVDASTIAFEEQQSVMTFRRRL